MDWRNFYVFLKACEFSQLSGIFFYCANKNVYS
jgi:hypothetical protein